LFLFVSYNKNKVNGFGLCLQWIFHQIQLGSYQRALPVPGILKLCNYLQNVVAITYIFGLQLSTFLFYNKHTVTGVSKLLKKFEGYTLLIIDEWLIDELSRQQEHFLFELVERRHTDKSTILCTQYRIEDWHARLGGSIHADAIIDRIVNNSVHIYAGELNMRKVKNTP